ncbi:helix-turn-helix domain-containing protein [Streptomyces xanthophaeus]
MQGAVVSIPAGHKVTVEESPKSTEFLGRSFAMDSLEFLRWLAVYFHDDLLTLRVALFLMGSQEPGGLIKTTQKELATALGAHRVHVNRSVGVLYRIGVVHMVQRGMYQLNPQASLRGGVVEVEEAEPRAFATGARVKRKIDQLALIEAIDVDPKVLGQFKNLTLPEPHPRKRRLPKQPIGDEAAEG